MNMERQAHGRSDFSLIFQKWEINQTMHVRVWINKVLGKFQVSEGPKLKRPWSAERLFVYLANFSAMTDLSGLKDMHIREWINKVLGKSAMNKRGWAIFQKQWL